MNDLVIFVTQFILKEKKKTTFKVVILYQDIFNLCH